MSEPSARGSNGGNARAAKLTKEQRSAIAVMAAKKRWGKPKEEKKSITNFNMRLYSGSSTQFLDDTIHNEIGDKLKESFFQY